MKQSEGERLITNALSMGEVEQSIEVAQRLALQVAQLVLDYSNARSEGRYADAQAIKAEAMQLKAHELGIEYSVFVAGIPPV